MSGTHHDARERLAEQDVVSQLIALFVRIEMERRERSCSPPPTSPSPVPPTAPGAGDGRAA